VHRLIFNEQVENIIDNLPQLVSIFDCNLRYTYVNKTYEKWFQKNRTEIVGRNLMEIIGAEGMSRCMSHIAKAVLGEEVQFEVEFPLNNGPIKSLNVRFQPLFESNTKVDQPESSKVTGILSVIRDLTDSKNIESQYWDLFQNVPTYILAVDENLFINQFNSSTCQWLGYTESDLFQCPLLDLIHAEDALFLKEKLSSFHQKNSSFSKKEIRFRAKSGKFLWGRVSSVSKLSKNQSENIFLAIEDIAEIKQMSENYAHQKHLAHAHFDALNACSIVAITDRHGRISYVNEKFCEISGYDEDELVGKNHRILSSGVHPRSFFEEMWHTISSGNVWRGEICNRNKRGQLYWVDTSIVPLKNTEGKIHQFMAIRYEITSRVQAKQALNQNLQWQNAVMDGANYAIVTTNLDGIISTFNRAAEKMFGYSATETVGKLSPTIFYDLQEIIQRSKELSTQLDTKIDPGFDVFTANTKRSGCDFHEWTYLRKDGSKFIGKLCVTGITDEKNEIIGFLCMTEDLTEQKKLLQTIEMQRAQMISSSRMMSLGEMAGGIAHEINNPLAVIKGKIEQVRRKYLAGDLEGEKLLLQFEKMEESVERISKIVSGLRSFSREASDESMTPTPVQKIVDDTVELCMEKFKNHGIDLKIPSNIQADLECRSSQISQILMNLLNNSLDSIESLPEKWIHIDIQESAEEISFLVTDSGHGIPSAIADKIMQPFFTTKDIGKGMGLGLSISQGIASAHQGKLIYDHHHPNTRFIITLPKRQSAALKIAA
jgi:PAS domain S-box-containing protein